MRLRSSHRTPPRPSPRFHSRLGTPSRPRPAASSPATATARIANAETPEDAIRRRNQRKLPEPADGETVGKRLNSQPLRRSPRLQATITAVQETPRVVTTKQNRKCPPSRSAKAQPAITTTAEKKRCAACTKIDPIAKSPHGFHLNCGSPHSSVHDICVTSCKKDVVHGPMRRSARLAAMACSKISSGERTARNAGEDETALRQVEIPISDGSAPLSKPILQNDMNKRKIMTEGKSKEQTTAAKHCCSSSEWTDEQDEALHKAYFTSRPSPHFWKKVSKMVPGKSAEECFNRIHAEGVTPPTVPPRSRMSRLISSPQGNFTLLELAKSKPKSRQSLQRRYLCAQKTVRHLLRKHQQCDQAEEADYFSVFETSPNALVLDTSGISPGTPDSQRQSSFLQPCKERSSSAKKKTTSSIFKTELVDPSPAVLKRVKNMNLHERYIDQLHCRVTRRSSANVSRSQASNGVLTGVLKSAKATLISEAKSVVGRFIHLQANPPDHMISDEDEEDSSFYCDSDCD